MTQEEAFRRLNVEVDLIPSGASNRPGTRIHPTFITIHNTANASPGADARMHARYVKSADARAREVSWHFTVDDQRCVKHLPTNEKGWHAGRGNGKSIGVEICEHQGIDHEAAADRASLLAGVLMLALRIPPENIVPHRHWTGKDCPHRVLRQDGGFQRFRERAAQYLMDLQAPVGAPELEGRMAAVEPGGAVGADLDGGLAEVADAMEPEARGEPTEGDRIAQLERLVGRLMLENEQLRERLDEAYDLTREAD